MQKAEHLKLIQEAKSQKNYDLMLASAQEARQAYPEDKDFEELLHDAQGYYVNQKLESELLKSLEAKEDWQALQAVYLKLLTVFPESKKLHKLLDSVRAKIEKTAAKAKEEFYAKAEEQIRTMMKEGKYDDAENACYEILSAHPEQSSIIGLLAKVQHRIDRDIEKALSLYYSSAVPSLKKDYAAHRKDYIRV